MKGILFLSSIVVLATAKPGGYYHQEYNYKSSSASYKNNELQQKNENQGFYSKDGDLEGRMKPKVNSHSQHSEYTNPKLLQGESVDLGTGYTGGNMNQANFGRLFGSNMNGYHSGGAADTFASTDRIMDLSNVYTSGGHGSSHRNFGTSMGYGNHAGGYGTNSLGYGTSSGGYGSSSSGYTSTSNGYGSNLGDYGRTHESMGTSNGGNYANSMGSSSNYGYTQGGRSYGYVQHGSSSSGYRSTNANLNSMVQRLQDEMTRQLQNAVNNQYRTSGYTTSVSTSQMTADIRALEDELKRNLTRQMEESLRSQYGQQELRGTDYYTVVPGRQSTVANYRNQELADLTGQLEDNLLKQLHQSIRTTYNRESGSTYTSSNNLYRPTYVSSTYRPSHYERTAVVIPSNIRYTPIPNPDSITQIASRIQSEINLYLDNALQNIYSTYIQNGRNSYTLTDFDNEVNRIRDQIIRNLTWNLDDQIRRNYGQQILKDDHYYSISSTGQTSTLHNYNVKDYENLKKQVEENLMKKLNQTVNTYRDQYQKQQSYSTSTNYYTATFRPVYYTSGNQVYDYSDLQRQLSEQLQNALNKHRYSQSASYSVSTSSNPRAYQISLDELSRELQRNLTEQLNNYRAHSSSSSYGYTSGSSIGGRSADFESMKNQLQNQLMRQLQQGLQKQYRYSASASYSASSSSSSNANYGSHQSYGNYGNMYPSHRYKRDAALYIPAGHHFSYKSAKSSRTYSSSSQFSSQEENGGMNFLHHTHDLKPHEFDDSMNFHRTSGSHFGTSFAGSDESSPEVVEDVINHHQVERPQKLYMAGHHQGAFGNPQNYLPNYHHFPESHHNSVDEELRPHHPEFPEQDMQEQLMNKNSGHYSTQQFQQTADSHFRFAQHHQLPEQQSQVDLDQKLEFNHPQQQQTDDYQKQVAFTPAIQVPEQQSQEDLEQKLEFKHPQLPEQQSQEDLHQKLEFQHPHQIQTHNSRKHFELTSDQHEQQPQEDLDQQLELNHPRIPKPIISYHQQPDQNLEDQNELTQQLEQEPQLEQKIQKPDFSSVHHQQTEDLDSQKLEPLEQQVDNQNELPKDLEQQQLEQDHIPEPKRAQHSGKSKDELTGNFDQNQDDLTQQLEEEPKYHPQIDNQPIEDLNYQQVQTSNDQKQTELHHMPSNKQSPEQDDLTQQQIQDDLTQQQIQDDLTQPQLKDDLSQQQIQDDLTQPQLKDDLSQQQIQDGSTQQQIQDDLSQQLTDDHIPVNEPGYPPGQELEQQSETDAKNVIVAEKINQQTEKPKFENQNDLTQEQELEQQLETESKNLFVPEKLNHRPDQQELEDQNDLTQQYEVEGKQEKTHSQESDLTQQLELARKQERNLIPEHHLEVEPKSSTKPKQGAYDQSQVEQSEEDMTQQLLLDNKPKPKNIPEQELTGQVEDDLNQKLEQQQTTKQEIPEQENTQQQETEQSLEPVDQKLAQKHQDQTENDVSQELELASSNKLERHPNVEQPKHNVDQKLELSHPQKHDQLDQQVQKQTDLDSIPKRDTHIENEQTLEQTLEQSSENHLTQQLESDNIATHRKPNYSPNFNQELENNNDQQLELTDIHKPQDSVTNNDQQTQLKLTDVKTENDQKQQTDQSIDEFPEHSLNHLDNPITVNHQRPQSVFNNYQHSSSSERSFTNSHSGYPTGNYEEALRQQDALLDLLKQKIHQQSENPSPYGQRIIKKTTYINGSPVSTFGTGHFTESNGEIKNSETTSLNENTFPGSQLTGQHGIYRHGYTGTTSSKSTRTVVHFVNGKPVSAMEYIRIVKPNGQIVDSKHEIPLTPDLIKRFAKGSSPNHVADTMRTTNHFVGSTEDISASENFIRQHPYSHRTTGHHTINMADNTERTGHYGVHPTENFFQNKQFSHHLHQGQLTKNMGNHFKVDGLRAVNRFDHVVGDDHDITSMGDLLRQNEFSQGVNQFSQHINDRLDGLGVSSHSFPQDINAFDNSFKTSGFSGQASKKTSYYVNGKLVSSSESHQRIGPDGRITEVERGSNPSLIGNLEQQLADLQDSYSDHKGSVEQQISGLHNIYSGHKSKDTSRCRVNTSRHIRRIDC